MMMMQMEEEKGNSRNWDRSFQNRVKRLIRPCDLLSTDDILKSDQSTFGVYQADK